MKYEIISTGSKGNAVVVEDILLIDCGVSFKSLLRFYKKLQLVLLTHIHSDHFKKNTIKKLCRERPTLRFGTPVWLVGEVHSCGVNLKNIDIYTEGEIYSYTDYLKLEIIQTTHNVSNCAYKIHINDKSVFYATDTNDISHIEVIGYDLYMVEANYNQSEIVSRIKQKQNIGCYIHEYEVLKNHLSEEKCNDFIYKNIRQNGSYVYMHRHIDKSGGGEV